MSQEVCHAKAQNYPPEFKHEAVELTRMEEVTISQIARDPGISARKIHCRLVIGSTACMPGWLRIKLTENDLPSCIGAQR
jgi:hypothetical protein